MKCSRCGFENPNGFKFCGQCGAKLEVISSCPNCGTTLPSNAKFCPECGTQVRVDQFDTDNTSGIDTCPTELEFVVGSCRFKMIKVEGGTFTMGVTTELGDYAYENERPIHKVTLSDYYIGQTEVPQALWTAVMGDNPSEFKGDNLPVEQVSWYDCQIFIEKLNSLLSNELGGKHFAFPTEAQWEFAARGGNKSQGYKYAGSNNIDDVAWFEDNSGNKPHPVAQKQPNELGLYDMSGNVDEWCQDWCDKRYYLNSPENNPQGPASGTFRVNRGGGCGSRAWNCRVSARFGSVPDIDYSYFGLRLCLIDKINHNKCFKCGFENPTGFKFCGQCGSKLEVNNKCHNCGFENPNGFKFCGQCGAKLEVISSCPNCGTTLPSNAKFCPECGTRVRVDQFDTDNTSGIDTCPTELEFVVGSCRFKMIKVEGGTFTMGATKEQEDIVFYDERPAHQVTLLDYYIGQTEVTQALWTAVMGWKTSHIEDGNLPVEEVCWKDCQAFIQKLNSLLSNELCGKHFALPTEAQWEFAARGGNKSQGYKYAGSNNIDDVAWFEDNSGNKPHPVAQKQPNELGLYDMTGNVWEWCQDGGDVYRSITQTNPNRPADGTCHVYRGGGYYNRAWICHVLNGYCNLDGFHKTVGLRLCLIP